MKKELGVALLEALKAEGAQEIFGLPGDFALPLFKTIEETGILPCYTLSHEPAVGFAADAAARLHRGISVAAVTYGAGALNMVNAVAAAYSERSPVVVLSGAPGAADRATGLGVHHQAKRLRSQLDIYREVTCAQAVLDDVDRVPERVSQVLARCRAESRPVYIELPRDMLSAPCAPIPHQVLDPVDAQVLEACVEEVAGRIAEASHPVLLVGVEIRRYGLERAVEALARKLGIEVFTTFMGRGLLAESNAPVGGTYMGIAGDPAVAEAVESSDALLMLGVIMADSNFGPSVDGIDPRNAIIAADGEVSLGFHTYHELPLADFVEGLVARVDSRTAPPVITEVPPTGLVADDGVITPHDMACAVNDLFKSRGRMPVASDMGDCIFTAMDFLPTRLVAPGYYATMGFGVPAGIGLQAASGERVLIVVGDGAFQMTGWELLNCGRYGWDPIVIVFNNASWEMLRAFQPESRFNDLDLLNFAQIAETLGGDGHSASTRAELKTALERAAATRGRFQLIDARMTRGDISPRLTSFVAGFQRLRARSQ